MANVWTQEQEAENLQKRFDDLKAREGVAQAEFARRHKVPGGASMLSQHIKGRRPINLESALAYADGFGVSLAEISPRLAADVERAKLSSPANASSLAVREELAQYNVAGLPSARRNPWPFPRIDFDKFVGLSPIEARHMENAILAAAGDLDLDIRVARPTKSKAA